MAVISSQNVYIAFLLDTHPATFTKNCKLSASAETNGQFTWNHFFLTIPGHVELHQLHEVGYFWRESLNLVITQSQLS